MPVCAVRAKTGGAEGIRTPDLLIANETLYQLSYDPNRKRYEHSIRTRTKQAQVVVARLGEME